MTPPQTQRATAHRTCLFAVDDSSRSIDELLRRGWEQTTISDLSSFVESITRAVINRNNPVEILLSRKHSPAVVGTGVALSAIRVEHTTPFRSGDDSYRRRTNVDVEQPLQQNPGGSAILSRLRSAFQEYVCERFDDRKDIRQLSAQVILSQTEHPLLAKEDVDAPSVTLGSAADGHKYARIPQTMASRWFRIVPQTVANDSFPPVRQDDEFVYVPLELLRAKLRAYAGYSFDRLAYRGYHEFRDWRRHAVKQASWSIEKEIHDKYRTNHIKSLYGNRRYDTSGPSSQSAASEGPEFQPAVHNRQLTNIVDVIRGTESLSFTDWHTASEIYQAALEYYPPPHRPSMTLRSVQRVAQVLQSAADKNGTTVAEVERRDSHSETSVTEYRIAEPHYTPFYTLPSESDVLHRWVAYRQLRARYSSDRLPDKPQVRPAVRSEAGTDADPLENATTQAHHLVATQPHVRSLDEIDAAVRPTDLSGQFDLSHPEIRVLTRIGVALKGLIRNRTLVDGMSDYTKIKGEDIADQLCLKGVLEPIEEPYPTLYAISSEIKDELGLISVSHEGFGERTDDETPLHRYGTDLLGTAFAERDEVATVRRYVDAWRLNLKTAVDQLPDEPQLQDIDRDDLRRQRIDVVAFDADDEPLHVGEVQLSHGKPSRVQQNWTKLRAIAELGATAVWVSPNFSQLAAVLRALQREGCVPPGEFPTTDGVSVWQNYFDNNDLYSAGLSEINTYRSLYREVDTL